MVIGIGSNLYVCLFNYFSYISCIVVPINICIDLGCHALIEKACMDNGQAADDEHFVNDSHHFKHSNRALNWLNFRAWSCYNEAHSGRLEELEDKIGSDEAVDDH